MEMYKRIITSILCAVLVTIVLGGVFTLLTTPLEQELGLSGISAKDFDCVTIYQHRERTFVWYSKDPLVIDSLLDAHRQGVAITHPRPAVGEYLSFHFHYKNSPLETDALVIGMVDVAHYVTKDGQFLALFGTSGKKWIQLLGQCDLGEDTDFAYE